jgi:hypothetical protein
VNLRKEKCADSVPKLIAPRNERLRAVTSRAEACFFSFRFAFEEHLVWRRNPPVVWATLPMINLAFRIADNWGDSFCCNF